MPRMNPLARAAPTAAAIGLTLASPAAFASIFSGETLDTVANVVAWIVLIVVPVIAIAVFWLVHILPEKIAEKRQHPQAKAIQVLCLLSLFFGGLLWPLAWLWAYSKPVLYKLAYGTDKAEPEHGTAAAPAGDQARAEELARLRQRIAELEAAPDAPQRAQG
jgi:CBS domain containing-hemolysin-like protein